MTLAVVLDTNVVLDWLVFEDPDTAFIRSESRGGRLNILTNPLAIEELRHVLGRPQLKVAPDRQAAVLADYQGQACCVEVFDERLPQGFPRCSDPSDDLFLALAYHSRAQVLVSRDKALLALNRKSAQFGFAILTAQQLPAMGVP